jgi:hypothetical protein
MNCGFQIDEKKGNYFFIKWKQNAFHRNIYLCLFLKDILSKPPTHPPTLEIR